MEGKNVTELAEVSTLTSSDALLVGQSNTLKRISFANAQGAISSLGVVGVMATGTSDTAAATATKAVTSTDWVQTPGRSILVEFSNANSASNVSLSINSGTAIPVYYLNSDTEQVSGNAIPAGAVVFTLNAAGNKFYAHLTKTLATLDTSSALPIDSTAADKLDSLACIQISDANLAIPKEHKDAVYFIPFNGRNLPSSGASGNIEVSRASSYLVQRFHNYNNKAWTRKASLQSNQWDFGDWEKILKDSDMDSAFSHNIPRLEPKNITSYVSDGTIWKRLNGTNGYALFEDIYVGDYFEMSRAISAYDKTETNQKTGSKFVTIAGIDTLWGNGDINIMSKHHFVMIPGQGFDGAQHFGRARMESTPSTAGGYKSSEMNEETIGPIADTGSTILTATVNQQLYAEFGTHLQITREFVSNSTNDDGTNRLGSASNLGCSNNYEWISAQAILMSEVEVYGGTVFSSSGYDTGTANSQLPLFKFSNQAKCNRTAYYWLKDVASKNRFCGVSGEGGSAYGSCNSSGWYVRPRFVLA